MATSTRDTNGHHPLARARRRARRLALAVAIVAACMAAGPGGAAAKTAFDGNGMWIWNIPKSSGGSPSAIAAKAHQHHIRTVFVKSGDAMSNPPYWPQFPQNVGALKAGGLKVCAWQFVYGDHPKDEAKVAAEAIRDGADCFVIDAESQYEGKYSAARTYMSHLRKAAGKHYPIGLASFPYVDYHPALPYSVFLGPGGAQFNVPQVYWKEIGTTVGSALGHTYRWNMPYGRPIYPLGQLFEGVHPRPSPSEVVRFRKYARAEGARGVSWWVWEDATSSMWNAVSQPLDAFKGHVETQFATIARGDQGDIVLWAQEHLAAAGESTPESGVFDSATERAVKRFQKKIGVSQTGVIDSDAWAGLLSFKPSTSRASVRAASVTPRSASLPAARYEIPPPWERHP